MSDKQNSTQHVAEPSAEKPGGLRLIRGGTAETAAPTPAPRQFKSQFAAMMDAFADQLDREIELIKSL